jgi:hypothetical protein
MPGRETIADHDSRSGQNECAAPVVEADDAGEPVWGVELSLDCGTEPLDGTSSACVRVETRGVGGCSSEVLAKCAAEGNRRLR